MTSPTNEPAGYAAARSHAALFAVSARGKIEVVGTEAAIFLHNLSTNDVKNLPSGQGCETFFCTATAKVVAHGLIWRCAPEGKKQRLWLDVTAGQGEKLLSHLRRFIISEDVTLIDHTAELAELHLAGPTATDVLQAAGIESGPWQRLTFHETPEGITVRHVFTLGVPGFDLVCNGEQVESVRQRLLDAGAAPADADAWELLRIEAGTPLFGIDLDETTFAPEVNRTALAISYNKGCYLGQEPIVMARDRGAVQRGLVGLHVGPEPVPTSSPLYRDSKEVGRVTSSVYSPGLGHAIALAQVRRGSLTPGTELELEAAGVRRVVRVTALPFAN